MDLKRTPRLDGYFWDVIERRSGGVVLVETTAKRHNLITRGWAELVARLLKGDGSNPIQYHGIGEGDVAWDTSPEDPFKTDDYLVNELGRLAPDSVKFIKTAYGIGTANSTSTRLYVTDRFEPDDFFNTQTLKITGGTGSGQSRTISDYVTPTRTTEGYLEVSVAFSPTPDETSTYEVVAVDSVSATPAIQVQTTFDYGSGSEPWQNKYIREQGLFGGDATATVDTGIMVNEVRHAKIWKDTSVSLLRTIQLVLRV